MKRHLCRTRIVFAGFALFTSAGVAIGAPRDEIKAPSSPPSNVDLKGAGYSADLKGKIVVYKVKLAGGNAWWSGSPNSWAIFDIVDGRSVIIKQSTLLVNGWTGYAKWWDHNVIAARACKQTQAGWDDCPTTIWLRGRAKQVDRSGGVQLNPDAMRRAPGHACSPHRSTDCAVHVQTTSRQPPGGGCRCGGHFGEQCPPD
jgi:hypothetical protein